MGRAGFGVAPCSGARICDQSRGGGGVKKVVTEEGDGAPRNGGELL